VSVSETEGVAYIARLYEMEATRDYEPPRERKEK
jgi:hypothetical protein